ncbi:MAG: hypothetical protein HFJ60_04750 [Clostridia bacterium]|nr:hypothetical protein [Clostridia bacterium]
MKNQTKIVTTLVVVAIVIIAIIAVIMLKDKKENNSKLGEINSSEDLVNLVEKIYEGKQELLPGVDTNTIDVTDSNMVKSFTGLENGNNLEYLVVSEPMISSQAYSLVLAKVKNGTNANEVAKTMSENVDQRKWICVTAEKLYATNSGDIVCLVMSSEEWAKPVYETFKNLAGSVGKEYEKTDEIGELPDELYSPDMMQ